MTEQVAVKISKQFKIQHTLILYEKKMQDCVNYSVRKSQVFSGIFLFLSAIQLCLHSSCTKYNTLNLKPILKPLLAKSRRIIQWAYLTNKASVTILGNTLSLWYYKQTHNKQIAFQYLSTVRKGNKNDNSNINVCNT